ncbi:tRNA (adenosine(37)-N6)-threonylcarbamoyltransferase complex dimerization subunit type 1 TsaB [Pararhodospirillum oryzae]|uniref:tRNA (Adenosine(37)-N6)-threonylcarbamoyltransferase complex dimerization subunit type 1 TsaB n=1 Tax=Pararhodospirillum oryzae TaxID=478448 RepID=A0A512H6V3_9PROT|nr:tRNA (adenosine(37)-N6)-threonylcarbamoyltransferase complex dimerization subunit type 1 TsaB [Pararhodospirillum oryzae]GEO81199.1 tRNA (adenosine(37)-N6)-threonylcarbamoyltransferase complex dimerization subunit type 1 TsaB [Pararhodospirillum oryzae]
MSTAAPTLALDTALAACSVAVTLPDGRASARTIPMERGQAEALVPLIASVLEEAGLEPAAVGRIAVTVGPGSFTGLRVGLATARGLGLALGCPVEGITVGEALADAVLDEAPDACVLVLIDSRRGDLFAQTFQGRDAHGLPRPLDDPRALPPDAARAAATQAGILLVGDGVARLDLGEAGPALPDPVRVARLAGRRPADAVRPPVPLYLRPPDARPAPNGGRLWA